MSAPQKGVENFILIFSPPSSLEMGGGVFRQFREFFRMQIETPKVDFGYRFHIDAPH
jgi:hypothetical protein